jgi:cold shock CspA family protein/ribosome-associated translation inhibitor RaiA
MKLPLQIVFDNLPPSAAIEARVRKKADKLNLFCDDIMGCRVVVEAPHKHQNQGNLYRVRIKVTVPDEELVVSRDPAQNQSHEDVYVAIRDSFDAMRRQLEDYTRRRRGQVKHHENPPHGKVTELFPDEGYGIIKTPERRLIYFHRNSVVDTDFSKLEKGSEVRFVEEMGEKGPQASTVYALGKHHIVG